MDLLDEAAAEAQRARRANLPEADLARRQAAEKIWGYVASGLNRLFRDEGLHVESGPGAHGDRRKWLEEFDRVLGTNLARRHEGYADLHGSCFYDGACPDPDSLEVTAHEAREFVEEVRRALAEVRRRGARPA